MLLADLPTSRDKVGDLGHTRQNIVYGCSVLRSPRRLDPFDQRIFLGVRAARNYVCHYARDKQLLPMTSHGGFSTEKDQNNDTQECICHEHQAQLRNRVELY
jgi:hypothetical protein